jgi:hypothetical protein
MRLSNLQKCILALAMTSRRSGHSARVDVTPSDVKRTYYQFPVRRAGGCIFNRSDMGSKRYNTAGVCIARSFDRLAKRGLVERHYGYGVKLTEKGEVLSANFLSL